MKKLSAIYKLIKSYFKKDWSFSDYPLETWKNTNAGQIDIQFGASFVNWSGVVAHGETKNQAIENLKLQFKDYKKNNDKIPRPGKFVPFEFAETVRIDKYEKIAVDFFDKIIGINYFDCFISDYTSLVDFDLDNSETIEKIVKEYGIEPKGEDYFLADIFELIHKKNERS